MENFFTKALPSNQKLRGGYYTPKPIADFLAMWAIQSPDVHVLDPSCGDGALLQAAVEALIRCGVESAKAISQVHGVEIDSNEAKNALERISALSEVQPLAEIHVGDFFNYSKNHLSGKRHFDAIIGNPPFIRYQNFPEEHRTIAFDLMKGTGLRPNRLTNSWVPFLVASTLLLNKAGRIAMVIPAELLQVNYAAELRQFLSEYYSSITLVTFKKLVFQGIQQEVVLLLGERNGLAHHGIRALELDGIADLQNVAFPKGELKEMDHSTEKWTMYFLEKEEIELLRRLKQDERLTISGKIIDVDVGIVTGLNKFFVLTEQQVNERILRSYSQPIVGRSTHLQGAIFSRDDWEGSVRKQAAAFLLTPPNLPFDDLPDAMKKYVLEGEEQGVNKGYKCRIRKQWYIVPSVWTPDAFMLRQIHNYPKLILNSADATCTDTIHRVRIRGKGDARVISAAFLNSLTFAFVEITGRSYGGGVLELEPNEAEQLPIPMIGAEELDIVQLDKLLREKDIYAVLEITDEILLKKGLGFSNKEVQQLRGIWEKLRDRRVNRKHATKVSKV